MSSENPPKRGPRRRDTLGDVHGLAWLALACIIMGLALAASCAPPAYAGPNEDAAFIDTLIAYDVPMPGGASEAQRVAHVVCDDLAAGATILHEIAVVHLANLSYSSDAASYFVGAAVGAYCPQFGEHTPQPADGVEIA